MPSWSLPGDPAALAPVVAEPISIGRRHAQHGIAAQYEEGFVTHGHAALLADFREAAENDADGEIVAAVLGMLQLGPTPWALHRSAQWLVEMPPPTARDCLLSMRMRRALVFGTRSPMAEVGSEDPADWPYLNGLEAAGCAQPTSGRWSRHGVGEPSRVRR